MDHSEAEKLNAVERYLLGELTVTQRDAFEEHYFGCAQCADDLKAGAAFVDNAREAFRTAGKHEIVAAPRPSPSRGWLWWLRPGYAAAAVALLLVVVGYQNFVTIPQIKQEVAVNHPQALPTFSLSTATRAAGETPEFAVRRNEPFGVYVDIPASDKFSSYRCDIRTASGKQILSIDVSAEQAKEPVQLFIPGKSLQPGQYELVVSGHPAANLSVDTEVIRRAFVVKELP